MHFSNTRATRLPWSAAPGKGGRKLAGVLFAAWLAGQPVAPAWGAATDWHALGEEAADVLTDILRIDTTNPPGGETAAANALARKLAADGIAAEIIESAPGRGNLVARLPGTGGGRPLILLAHLDVVPADSRGWRFPPFSGARDRGYVYGRGALDAKGVAVTQAMALLAVKRSGQPLTRDLILLATADEETGGRAGAGWIVQHRPDLLGNAEFLLTEGDYVHVRKGVRGAAQKIVQVSVVEKTPCWIRITAHGEAGPGAVPPAQTAVTRLVRALNKLRRYQTSIRVVRPVEEYFAALAPLESEPLRHQMANLAEALQDPGFLAEFTHNPQQNALVRDTMTPTVLVGSSKTNVIPAEASADLDGRLLPGETPAEFLALLREEIGDDMVHIEQLFSFPSAPPSDARSSLITALRRVANDDLGGAPVVPSVIPGFTDSRYFRERGIQSYGFVPFILTDEDEKSVHGLNERISIDNLRGAIRRFVALLRALPPSSRL